MIQTQQHRGGPARSPNHFGASWAQERAPRRFEANAKLFSFKIADENNPLGPVGSSVVVDNGKVFVNGSRIDLSLHPTDVRLPTEIPTYLAGYKPMPFRADEISPVIMVTKDEDWRRDFSLSNAFRRVNVKAGPEGAIPEIDPSSSLVKYKTVDRLLGSFVPTVTEDNAAGTHYRPRQVAAKRIGWALQLDREIDVFDMLLNSSNWNANNVIALGASAKWNGGASVNILGNLQTAIVASAQMVTGIVVNQETALVMLKDPGIRDQYRQMYGDSALDQQVQTVHKAYGHSVDFVIPGLPPVRVMSAKVLNETTDELDFVMGPDCLLVTCPPGVPTDGEEIATTYSFRVRGNVGVGYETREFRVEGRGQKGGTMVVVYQSDIAQMTGSNCGGLIQDCIQ
jgi:hypothetical protein